MVHVRLGRGRRGVFIISVLLTTMLIAMFIGAAISITPSALGRTAKTAELMGAHAAAVSGIEYALARLQKSASWRAATYYEVNEPGLIVRENQGNVIGLVMGPDGRVLQQFRIRFNLENGNPAADPDQMANSVAPFTVNYLHVSYNNVQGAGEFTVPAVGAAPAVTVPARAIYLAVEGCSGPACQRLSATNFNAPLVGFDYSRKSLRSVYKISNIGQNVPQAAAMAAGLFKAALTSDSKDVVVLGAASGSPGLRSKDNIEVTRGSSTENLASTSTGNYRLPKTASPDVKLGSKTNLSRQEETGTDEFYSLPWSQVRQADGTNTLAAGTYVWFDDGSLHYFDMAPSAYLTYTAANPLDEGTTVYTQSEGVKALSSGVNVSSKAGALGSALDAKFQVHKDTKIVPSGTGTTEFGVIPRKGAAEQPSGGGGTGTGTTAEFRAALLGPVFNMQNFEKFEMKDASVVSWMQGMGAWADANGYGEYDGSEFEYNDVELKMSVGAGNPSQIPPSGGWGNLQFIVNAYLASGATPPAGVTFATGNAPPGTAGGAAGLAQATPKNIKTEINSGIKGGPSVVLSSEDSITLGTEVTGSGASIVSNKDIKLVGLGVNLSALQNEYEGVSIYAGRDVFVTTLDTSDPDPNKHKFKDVSLKGVVYAVRNVTATLGNPAFTDPKRWGKFNLTGVMVAYGGDPSVAVPTTPDGGKIELTARNPKLTFDAAYLGNLLQIDPVKIKYGRYWWVIE